MKKTIATFLIIVGALAFVEIANAQAVPVLKAKGREPMSP